MSVTNLFKPGGLVWRPDSNDINAPDGTLLRADNMIPDEDGSLSVRRGSQELYTWPLGTEDVHSLYTYEGSDGETYRMMAADDQVYVNAHAGNHTGLFEVTIAEAASLEVYLQVNYTGGNWEKDYASSGYVGPVPFTARWEETLGYVATLVTTLEPVNWNTTFAGTGDIAFGDDHQQSFFARSTSHYKFDGKSFLNWSMAKPSAAASLSAVAPTSTSVFTFATGESGTITLEPDTIERGVTRIATKAYAPDALGNANQASLITPGRFGDNDGAILTKTFASGQNFSGYDQDIFEIQMKIDDPKHVRHIAIDFVDTGTPGGTDGSQFTVYFYPKSAIEVPVRDTKLEGQSAYDAKVTSIVDPVEPKDKPRVTTASAVQQIIAGIGTGEVPSTAASEPPAGQWITLAAARNQFERTRGATTIGWNSIDKVIVRFSNDDGFTGAITFADLVMYSAGAGTLSGTYRVVYSWIRETDRYYEVSPPSDESSEIGLYANQLRITIPAAAQVAADSQATHVWAYVFGGFLDTYYRAITGTVTPGTNATIVLDVAKNEVTLLTENEKLTAYADGVQDNVIAIAGPWNGRLFTLTSEGYVFPSTQTSPSTFNTYQVIDLSNQGDPLWMVKTSSGIHCGCERDVVFLAGSGDEDVDRVTIDLYPHPLNIGTPPFERGCVFVDGNSILYRSTDGLITLASQGLTHVPDDGIRLLWRGQTRHGVSALNTLTGRFRVTVDNKILYMLAPEGSTEDEGTTVVYRLDMGKGQWSRTVYPNALLSIFNEPDGTLVAGTNDGHVLELEYGTGDDNSVKPSVVIWTPYTDGGNPLTRKDPFDLQFHVDTNGNTATVNVHKDGSASSTVAYTFLTSIPQAYRCQSEDIGAFIRAQLRITGTFDEFNLSAFNLTYRVRGQHMTYLDTGYIVADDPSDVVWLQEAEIDVNSPSNIYCLVYLDDTLYTTETVTVTANVRTVYRVPLPRGTKARRPRIVVKTSAADGAGEIGFDPYFVRVRTRNSGNVSGNRYRTVWPVGSAP